MGGPKSPPKRDLKFWRTFWSSISSFHADDAGATEVEVTLELSSAGGSGGGPHPSAVRVWNNGRAFTDADWQRVRKIAAGNPDEVTPYFTCWQTGLHNDHHPHREKKQPQSGPG